MTALPLPLPRSPYILGFEWVSDRLDYAEPDVKGDTFPMTWADDDEIYTSAGDPFWPPESVSGLDVQKFTGGPTDYRITKVNIMKDYVGWGGDGPKPAGMICVDGILYLSVQNMKRARVAPFSLRSQHGSDAHIICASDKGYIWKPAFDTIADVMFPGSHFGGPVFINYGKNNANARDSYVYAISSDQWDNGSNLRLGRVPSNAIIRRESWEWVAAWSDSGQPVWHHDLNLAIPVLSLHRWLSLPEMVYIAGIQRYLLLSWRLHQDFSGDDGTDLVVMEAPEPWGPFSLVHLEKNWEGDLTPYSPRIPLKWLDTDGLGGWLQFSGSWTQRGQAAGYYRSHLRRFRLKVST